MSRALTSRVGLALVIATALPFATPHPAARAQTRGVHDEAFWREIVAKDYAVPQGETAFGLIEELDRWVGSPDPELRDDLGFTLTAVWITYRPSVSGEQLNVLLDRWRPGLTRGLLEKSEASGASGSAASGGAPGDAVLGRSFTALRLAVLAERDLAAPYLGPDRYRTLLNDALSYLRAETDLRGYDSKKGWFHATAHTADLLKYLARNPLLTPADQVRILDGVSERLTTAPLVFTHGEQDRLAQTLAAIIVRPDFDGEAFTAWLARVKEANTAVIKTRPLEPAGLDAMQNRTHLLEALHARLSKRELTGAAVTARTGILNILVPR